MSNSRLRKLSEYIRPYWKETLAGIVALFVVNIVGVYIPQLIGDSVDQLNPPFDFDQVWRDAVLILVLACLMWIIRMVSRVLIFGIGRQVEYALKQRIFSHLLQLEPAYFSVNTSGDLMNRATSDVDNIRRLLGFAVLSLVNTIFAYSFTLPAMLLINVRLTLWAVAVYPLMLITVQLFSGQLRSLQLKVQESLSDLSELIQEDVSGISLIKIYAQENPERRAFAAKNRRLLDANLKLAQTRNILFPLVEGIAFFSLLVLLWQGTGAIIRNAITVGDLVALILYVERLVFPTALLGFTITAYQRGEVSIDRVETILNAQANITETSNSITLPLSSVRGKLEARHLTYTYPNSTTPALKDVSFTIAAGETVAVVGSIGSGKSTLANAIPRLLDIEPGQIYLDGYDITQIRLADLRAAIAYVPQDSFLFSTTIKNNVRYGNPLTEGVEIELAAKTAQIHPEIVNFPRQYETLVGERGITLSGGQRQRTSLARALLVDAPVLILDDALSSVDNQTATQILDNLSGGVEQKTVIFITHQLSAAATCDRIFVMDQGKIVQIGSHAELIETPGLYQSLWQQQQLEAVIE